MFCDVFIFGSCLLTSVSSLRNPTVSVHISHKVPSICHVVTEFCEGAYCGQLGISDIFFCDGVLERFGLEDGFVMAGEITISFLIENYLSLVK